MEDYCWLSSRKKTVQLAGVLKRNEKILRLRVPPTVCFNSPYLLELRNVYMCDVVAENHVHERPLTEVAYVGSGEPHQENVEIMRPAPVRADYRRRTVFFFPDVRPPPPPPPPGAPEAPPADAAGGAGGGAEGLYVDEPEEISSRRHKRSVEDEAESDEKLHG